ncbi:MAG: diguanylate cyclase [Gammaproteobacteria bacterium]|nr:diguanylate cyclase [Gammaproteobacteria bacterium]
MLRNLPGRGWCTLALAGLLLAVSLPGFGADEEPVAVERLIDRAERLDTTASWQETRETLERVAERLGEASDEQRVRFRLLEARNRALAGEYREGLEVLTRLEPLELLPRHELRSLELCANLAMQISEYLEAFRCLNAAMSMQAEVDDPELQAGVFGLAAYWHSQLGDPDKGLRYGRRTLELARRTGSLREECVAHEKLGQAYELSGRLDSAIEIYRDGLPRCRESGDVLYTGVVQILLGRVLHRKGELQAAERWLQQGIEATRQSGFQDGVLDGQVNYGSLLFDLGRAEEAEDMLLSVVDEARSRDRWESLTGSYKILAEIAARRGDTRAAYDRLVRHLEVRENMLNIERARLIAFHEVEFDTLAREQQIELLEEQARISELEAVNRKQRRQLVWVTYTIAGFLLVVLALLLLHATRERRHYRRLSTLDSLTGLRNHTSFFSEGEGLLNECRALDRPATLILCDIDYFKQINDSHGHHAGDRVLVRLASRLRESFGEEALAGRIGGEEFAVMLAGADIDAAGDRVEALRRNIEQARSDDNPIVFTLSFGLAERREGESFTSLRERADRALYRAKSAGRDRIVAER